MNVTVAINVDEFMKTVIRVLSHPMYAAMCEFQAVIDKYRDSQRYSFMIMDRDTLRLYDTQYEHPKKWSAETNDIDDANDESEEIPYFSLNVLIVPHLNAFVDNNNCGVDTRTYPVLVRLKQWSATAAQSHSHSLNDLNKVDGDKMIGCPMKLFITQTDTAKTVVERYFSCVGGQTLQFYACTSPPCGDIDGNESIYGKVYGVHSDSQIAQIIITVETAKQATNNN